MHLDEFFIKQTIRLAKKGLGWTNPNPLVGAIIVKNDRIIGQGFHHQAGYPHAEIEALNSLKENLKGSTLYVNLEPCASFGKTSPCVDAIIKSSVKRVVFATLDPNPKNQGKGLAILKKSGIPTSAGILENEARKLNEAFFVFHERKRPFVGLKFAASLDGKIATYAGDSKWITSDKARNYARSLRSQYQAILVGINTVLTDNPNLGVRTKGKKDPIRIILDPKLQIPLNTEVLRDQNVIIATTNKADKNKQKQLESSGIELLIFNSEYIPIPKLLSKLKEKKIISILVEGGGETLGSFLDANLVDKVYAFHAPILIGGRKAVSIGGYGAQTVKQALHLKNVSFKKINDDLLTIGYFSNWRIGQRDRRNNTYTSPKIAARKTIDH